tara:strand:- start:3 stop:533 length:531 start_codon:yes stop_codon:yes gene_type:complete
VAGTFFSGFIPGTPPFITKKLKKLIQLIITDDAKPVDCENLHRYMIDVGRNPTMDSAIQSLSENEKIIGERVYMMGKMDVVSEKICDKSYMDSSIALFKNIQEAPEDEDVSEYCNDLKDIGNENEDKRHPSYYWDESKKEFIKDREYFSNAFGGKSGPELHEPVIAKCEAVGINIR